MLDDILKGNILTAVAVGLGAVLVAPLAGPVLRPAAKAAIKGGMLAYQGLAELGEMVGDIVAEAQAELVSQSDVEVATRPKAGRQGREASS
jgi:hypothetical protein